MSSRDKGAKWVSAEAIDDHRTSRRTQRAWGEWLSRGVFAWTHHGTLTTRYPASESALVAEFHRWIRRLEQRVGHKVESFYTIERGFGGQLHLHVLVTDTEGLADEDLEKAWKLGRSQVCRYDSLGGAPFYMTKDIPHSIVAYDISAPLQADRTAKPPTRRDDSSTKPASTGETSGDASGDALHASGANVSAGRSASSSSPRPSSSSAGTRRSRTRSTRAG